MSERRFDPSELKVEVWPVDRLIPYERNNKKHDEDSVAKLAASMKARGQITPVIVDRDGVIIAGHGRRMAAVSLGWDRIRVVQLDVDEDEARRMRLADNLASNQNYDYSAINKELETLFAGVDVSEMKDLGAGLGINDKELSALAPDVFGGLEAEESVVPEDIVDSVETFSEEGERDIDEAEEKPVAIAKALGFNLAKPVEARRISGFMAVVESETKLEGAAALAAWIHRKGLG